MATRAVFKTDKMIGDWEVVPDGFNTSSPLYSRVLISLFTDSRASVDDELPSKGGSRRGWWGDSTRRDGVRVGSKLWLLYREKATQDTLMKAVDYVNDALTWLTNEGLAASYDVAAEWQDRGFLAMQLKIYQPDGNELTLTAKRSWATNE